MGEKEQRYSRAKGSNQHFAMGAFQCVCYPEEFVWFDFIFDKARRLGWLTHGGVAGQTAHRRAASLSNAAKGSCTVEDRPGREAITT